MSRRYPIHLVLVVQHPGDTLNLRIRCLDLVQPAEQDWM